MLVRLAPVAMKCYGESFTVIVSGAITSNSTIYPFPKWYISDDKWTMLDYKWAQLVQATTILKSILKIKPQQINISHKIAVCS